MDKHVLLIGLFTIAGAIYLTSCSAEPQQLGPPGVSLSCHDPDTVTFRDVAHGIAVVTFYNSEAKCSKDVDIVMTTENGISARIVIWANPPSAGDSEEIKVFPETPGYFAAPPEAQVPDGDTVEVYVMGGLS